MEGGSQPQESQPQGLPICPRCGQPYRYLVKRKIGNNVYYYAVHYLGYERGPDGRPRPKLRWCYLGPEAYIEVTKTHSDLGLTLKGLMEEGRERDYMEALVRSVRDRIRGGRLTAEGARELAAVFSRFSEELRELARELSEYVAGEATKEAVNVTAPRQVVETPSVASQPQITEAGQGDAYRTISTLTGLPPDDIERQLAKLKEALKELKNTR